MLDLFLIGLEFVEFIPPATTYIYLIAFVYAIKQISVVAGTCPLGKVVEESRLLLCRDIWCTEASIKHSRTPGLSCYSMAH